MEAPLQPVLKDDDQFPLCVELNVPAGRSIDEGMDAIHAFLDQLPLLKLWVVVQQGFVLPRALPNRQRDGSTQVRFVLVKPPPTELLRVPQEDDFAHRAFLGMVNDIELTVFFARGEELHKRKANTCGFNTEEQAWVVARKLHALYAGKVDVEVSSPWRGAYKVDAKFYPRDWYGIRSGESKM